MAEQNEPGASSALELWRRSEFEAAASMLLGNARADLARFGPADRRSREARKYALAGALITGAYDSAFEALGGGYAAERDATPATGEMRELLRLMNVQITTAASPSGRWRFESFFDAPYYEAESEGLARVVRWSDPTRPAGGFLGVVIEAHHFWDSDGLAGAPLLGGIDLGIANAIRDDPLESVMRSEMDATLRSVPGVTDVVEEDREIWLVEGNPTCEAIVEAVVAGVLHGPHRARYIDYINRA